MYLLRFGKKIERMPYFLFDSPNINLRIIITITIGIITIHPNTDTIIVYKNHFNNIILHLLKSVFLFTIGCVFITLRKNESRRFTYDPPVFPNYRISPGRVNPNQLPFLPLVNLIGFFQLLLIEWMYPFTGLLRTFLVDAELT